MIGTGELIVIFLIVLFLFGGKNLPELARSIGLGIREFKKACNGTDEEDLKTSRTQNKQSVQEPVTLIIEPDHKDDSSK